MNAPDPPLGGATQNCWFSEWLRLLSGLRLRVVLLKHQRLGAGSCQQQWQQSLAKKSKWVASFLLRTIGNGNHFWVKQKLTVKQTDIGGSVLWCWRRDFSLGKTNYRNCPWICLKSLSPENKNNKKKIYFSVASAWDPVSFNKKGSVKVSMVCSARQNNEICFRPLNFLKNLFSGNDTLEANSWIWLRVLMLFFFFLYTNCSNRYEAVLKFSYVSQGIRLSVKFDFNC